MFHVKHLRLNFAGKGFIVDIRRSFSSDEMKWC